MLASRLSDSGVVERRVSAAHEDVDVRKLLEVEARRHSFGRGGHARQYGGITHFIRLRRQNEVDCRGVTQLIEGRPRDRIAGPQAQLEAVAELVEEIETRQKLRVGGGGSYDIAGVPQPEVYPLRHGAVLVGGIFEIHRDQPRVQRQGGCETSAVAFGADAADDRQRPGFELRLDVAGQQQLPGIEEERLEGFSA